MRLVIALLAGLVLAAAGPEPRVEARLRDVARLHPLFELAAVRPVDMFPHTAHVETVALLRRRA